MRINAIRQISRARQNNSKNRSPAANDLFPVRQK
jgi:hypothetical protein